MSIPNEKKKAGYKRIFDDQAMTDLAIDMLYNGYTHEDIAHVVGCTRASVSEFKKRVIEKRGYVFPKFKGDRPKVDKSRNPETGINQGKTYAEYLAVEKNKAKEAKKERMVKARETMAKLKAWRKKNGVDIDSDWKRKHFTKYGERSKIRLDNDELSGTVQE